MEKSDTYVKLREYVNNIVQIETDKRTLWIAIQTLENRRNRLGLRARMPAYPDRPRESNVDWTFEILFFFGPGGGSHASGNNIFPHVL